MRAALVLTVGLIVAPMYELHAQESSLQQQPTPSRQDREQLEQNIYFGDAESRELGVRCGTRTPDDLERELIDRMLAPHLQAAAKQTSSAITVIPVAFHVATTKTGKFNVSDSQIARQMTVLNHSFEPHGYRFELTLARRYRDNAFAKKCLNMRKERKFKNKHAEDPRRTLNIYTCRPAQGVLGYAYLPSDWRESDRRHGVFYCTRLFPAGTRAPTTWAIPRYTRSATTWACSTHSTAAAPARVTGSPTRPQRGPRRMDARPDATAVRLTPAATRCSTSWTTPTTPA